MGVDPLSNEVIIADGERLYKVRTVHRQPVEERWDVDRARQFLLAIQDTRPDISYKDPETPQSVKDDLRSEWDVEVPAGVGGRRSRTFLQRANAAVAQEQYQQETDVDEGDLASEKDPKAKRRLVIDEVERKELCE